MQGAFFRDFSRKTGKNVERAAEKTIIFSLKGGTERGGRKEETGSHCGGAAEGAEHGAAADGLHPGAAANEEIKRALPDCGSANF